jgi:hypothetical protein
MLPFFPLDEVRALELPMLGDVEVDDLVVEPSDEAVCASWILPLRLRVLLTEQSS